MRLPLELGQTGQFVLADPLLIVHYSEHDAQVPGEFKIQAMVLEAANIGKLNTLFVSFLSSKILLAGTAIVVATKIYILTKAK